VHWPNVRPYIVFFLFDFTNTKPNGIFSTCQDLVKDIIRKTLPFQQGEDGIERLGRGEEICDSALCQTHLTLLIFILGVFDFEAAKTYAISATLTW
jgi:hypothetical protein